MRIGYIISAYQYPEQLTRLIARIHTETATIVVHLDKKAGDDVRQRLQAGVASFPNVHLLPQHACYWGDFGHVAATLKGIDALLRLGAACDYVILLTGQDYPIKPNAYIEAFLRQHQGAELMESFPLPYADWTGGGMARITSWHVRCFNRRVHLPGRWPLPLRRRFPRGLRPFGGSSYWCLSGACIAYIAWFVGKRPDVVRFFRYVEVPDELFFQTIVSNSHFAPAVVQDNVHYIGWKDWEAASPSILGMEDFDDLARSPKLFARKFDATRDGDVLELIDQRLLSRV